MDAINAVTKVGGAVAPLLKASALWRSGSAASAEGNAIARAKGFEAEQLRVRAGQERAASQRRMLAEKKKEGLVQSALQARAAASGGGSDPSVVDLAGDIAAEGKYRAMTALYEGESLARSLESGADLKTFEGAEARRAGKIKKQSRRMSAFTTLLGGGGGLSFFEKYGESADIDQRYRHSDFA